MYKNVTGKIKNQTFFFYKNLPKLCAVLLTKVQLLGI